MTSCFQIPKVWWEECCRNANGYFGLEELTESTNPTGEKLSGLSKHNILVMLFYFLKKV